MVLTDDEVSTLRRLESKLSTDRRGVPGQIGFDVLDKYYEGRQRVLQLGLAIPDAELRAFAVVVGWPAVYVDTLVQRQQPLGFRMPGESGADEDLARVWQANDLDDESALGRLDARVFGRSYLCVGSGDDDATPLVTVESPLEMTHEQHPATRRVLVAGRFYADDRETPKVSRATLYGPGSTIHAVKAGSRGWEEATGDEWARDDHGLGVVPVEPVVSKGRVHRRGGRSVMFPVMPLSDAAIRALTNSQVAAEILAAPQRWAAGMSRDDFLDAATGKPVPAWEAYLGAIMSTANPDAKFGQFPAADLGNYARIVELFGQLVSSVTGLPLRYLGQLTTNPPSAEGIRADESRLVLDVEGLNVSDGAAYERMARLIRLFQGLDDDPDLASMETLWRNPATPTEAQTTDAAVKKFQAGLTSRRQALRDCAYTSVQIEQIEREISDEASDPVLDRVLRGSNADPAGDGGVLAGAGVGAGADTVGGT